MQFDIELIQHEYFCKCNFLKNIAISKWSGYVLFEFNPLVMVHTHAKISYQLYVEQENYQAGALVNISNE